ALNFPPSTSSPLWGWSRLDGPLLGKRFLLCPCGLLWLARCLLFDASLGVRGLHIRVGGLMGSCQGFSFDFVCNRFVGPIVGPIAQHGTTNVNGQSRLQTLELLHRLQGV